MTKIINRWWQPSKFKTKYTKQLLDYFNIEANFIKEIITTWKNDYTKTDYKEFANSLPTIQWFCRKILIDRETLYNRINTWKKWKERLLDNWETIIYFDPDYVEFFNTYKVCKEIQEQIWAENSLKWLYNPSFAIFFWKNIMKRKDKIETEWTIKHDFVKVKLPWSTDNEESNEESLLLN